MLARQGVAADTGNPAQRYANGDVLSARHILVPFGSAPPQPGPSSWTVTSAHDGAVYDVTVSYEVSPDPAAQGTTVTPAPLKVALTHH